eukprot:TRINITY_DN5404_c0_g1_i1.p1 TRINITY_DN5404_c0_g1~~TRINITY_DN5404_c0_g1_i1.p1  ORF type:complete len:311 (+),score=60.79 TRINITY_DN5404_c0_g1_i1:207-1139(+)
MGLDWILYKPKQGHADEVCAFFARMRAVSAHLYAADDDKKLNLGWVMAPGLPEGELEEWERICSLCVSFDVALHDAIGVPLLADEQELRAAYAAPMEAKARIDYEKSKEYRRTTAVKEARARFHSSAARCARMLWSSAAWLGAVVADARTPEEQEEECVREAERAAAEAARPWEWFWPGSLERHVVCLAEEDYPTYNTFWVKDHKEELSASGALAPDMGVSFCHRGTPGRSRGNPTTDRDFLPDKLIAEAYQYKTPADMKAYASALDEWATHLGSLDSLTEEEQHHLELAVGTARWLRFWSDQGCCVFPY